MMKIANITLDARVAGPQLSLIRVGKILKDHHEIETTVILPKQGSGKLIQILETHKLEYLTLRLNKLSRKPFKAFLWLLTFIPQTFMLARLIRKSKADLVHCSGSWQFKGIVAGKIAGKKIVWHMNDSKIPGIIQFIFKRINRFADGFIFTGWRVEKYYENFISRSKIKQVINAPVDTAAFDPHKSMPASFLRSRKGVKIVTIANVNPVKGIEHFAEAAHLLNGRYNHLGFYVIGGLYKSQNKYIRKIRQMIQEYNLDNFFLSGLRESVVPVLKDADIYVCTSLSEASPMSVWEAMAMQKPVVSTDVGSVSIYIRNGENGFVVPVGDSEKIAEKIGYLIEHPEEGLRFGKRAREVVVKELDNAKTAVLYTDIYAKIYSSESAG